MAAASRPPVVVVVEPRAGGCARWLDDIGRPSEPSDWRAAPCGLDLASAVVGAQAAWVLVHSTAGMVVDDRWVVDARTGLEVVGVPDDGGPSVRAPPSAAAVAAAPSSAARSSALVDGFVVHGSGLRDGMEGKGFSRG